jgi:hypothetical protein
MLIQLSPERGCVIRDTALRTSPSPNSISHEINKMDGVIQDHNLLGSVVGTGDSQPLDGDLITPA